MRELEETPGVKREKLAEVCRRGIDPTRSPEDALMDYVKSRYCEEPKWRPRRKSKRERYTEWMLEKI